MYMYMYMYVMQSAELSGYAFKALPEDSLSFTSLRLGHIKIKVGTLHLCCACVWN